MDGFFSSLISVTQFPSLITLKYYTRLAPSLTCHHLIFLTLFMGPIPVTWCFFFFFLSAQKKKHPRSNLGEERGKKKKRKNTRDRTQEKKRVNWLKGAAKLWLVGPHVCLITKIELWVMETENTTKMCFQFP